MSEDLGVQIWLRGGWAMDSRPATCSGVTISGIPDSGINVRYGRRNAPLIIFPALSGKRCFMQ
jgi:hypothetical protein